MRNCLILGSGRSGTSMVAGSLASSGYSMGAGLHPARASNPKGFFEAPEINQLNEELLSGKLVDRPALGEGQRWLGRPRADAEFVADAQLLARMQQALASEPWCFKDPRFSFTLDAWRPLLGDAAFVCVFRHPARTAQSLVEEIGRAAYLQGVELDIDDALALWAATYRSVLEQVERGGDWLFLHYDQALEVEGRERLGDFLGVEVDGDFADPRLRRSLPDFEVPAEALELYQELCRRARYEPAQELPQGDSETPRVSVVCLVDEAERGQVAEVVEDVRAQRGVSCELVLVDLGGADPLECKGAVVVHSAHPSHGVAWKRALEVTRGEFIALHRPGQRILPARLAHALDAFRDGVDLVTCDYVLTDTLGQFIDRTHLEAMGDEPGPGFECGMVLRSTALRELEDLSCFPVERALHARLLAAGRVAHVAEPGFCLPAVEYQRDWARSREDAALVNLASRPGELDQPRLTVSLCTYQRLDILRECIESFARQLVVPGTFEIVVVNDGSEDGTREYLEQLDLLVPLRVLHQENRGLAAARNAGLAVSRGELVLFINDDTIARAGLVEGHIEAHRRAGGERVCILGTFEQPSAALDNALMRYLEGSNEIFDFANLEEGPVDSLHFYTCNVSAPLEAVRTVGGFDESFRHYGCEDTDLGLRLEALGCTVHHDPRLRAEHRHVLSFEDFARRQRTVSRAYVRFFRKYPSMVERWNVGHLTAAWIEQQLAQSSVRRATLEAAARELSAIDIGRLERLGAAHGEQARAILSGLGEVIRGLNGSLWAEGYLEGLQEHGLAGLGELLEQGRGPGRLRIDCERALLAWPRWDDPDCLDELLARIEPLAADGFAALVLVHEQGRDGEQAPAFAALEAAAARVFDEEPPLEVQIVTEELGRADGHELARSVDALLPVGGEPEAFLESVGCERLSSAQEVLAWQRRFTGLGATTPRQARAGSALELSIVVPTHDRPRELAGLLEALSSQSLHPGAFEVLVVDDASRVPAANALAQREYPFELKVLRQEGGGPGAARNLGVEHARADTLVFFNDDASPEPDCLRRHRDAQLHASAPRVVIGTFELLPEHRRDSLALLIEGSTELFAQPAMRPGVLYHGLSLCSGNVSLPRSAFERVGGFDEALVYAGGEDSELGLRLERELGLRVQFDPLVRCGHDHDLDILQLARRKRVLGWAAHAIETRHPEAGVLEGASPDETDWEVVAWEVRKGEEELSKLVTAVAELCGHEREHGLQAHSLDALHEIVQRIGALEQRRGLLCAHEGRLPTDLTPEFSPPLQLAEASVRPTSAGPSTTPDDTAFEHWFAATEGMVSLEEARCLFELARAVTDGVIVEVGSYRGRSTVALAKGAIAGHGAPVYAIEPHASFTGVLGGEFGPADRVAFFQALLHTGCAEQVSLVNLSSEVVSAGWSEPVGLLWIDGDHSYAGVRRDWEAWSPRLLEGAVVAFDDATDPNLGPARLIAELEREGVLEPALAIGKVRVLRRAVTAPTARALSCATE